MTQPPTMKARSRILLVAFIGLVPFSRAFAEVAPARTPAEIFSAALGKIANIIDPAPGTETRTFSTTLEITKADGLPKEAAGQRATLAYQAPDRLALSAEVSGRRFSIGRDGQEIWIHAAGKNFGVLGKAGVPRFATAPEKLDTTTLEKFSLPKEQLALLPFLVNVEAQPDETIDRVLCRVVSITPKSGAVSLLKIPDGTIRLWVRDSDSLPARIGFSDGKGINVEVRLRDTKLSEPWTAEQWKIPARDGDKIEAVALSHLTRFFPVALSGLNRHIPTLGPATGERRVIATEGNGRLEMVDGTRVLFLKGTPEEMGRQHGALMTKQVRDLVDRILYGVGVGSSFEKGRWFFGEIEEAQARIQPFIEQRYLREMDAIALAPGTDREELRLAHFFPELFHCSGFALFGDATVGGKMLHGRVLDYLRGVGLEQNATVIVTRPDEGNAWVNISYAGFVGTVTAMNEKHIAIGEMGGRGEGSWDGKPMAQLLRELMEKAGTLDEAVAILRKGPRTCEYYYVISDAKTKQAVGIAATATTFEVVKPGEPHPRLQHPIKDAVLMSAGDRYEKLAERVKDGYGKFDAASARDLMTRPVCMTSNIHSVLFDPETLDFWVANADSKSPAAHTRYTQYNLAELLKDSPAPISTGAQ